MKTKCKGKKLSGFVIVAMILFLPVSPSSAHNLWLGLDHYDQRKGDTAKVFLYLAHSLPFADLAKPEKMKEFYYVGPSGKKINFD